MRTAAAAVFDRSTDCIEVLDTRTHTHIIICLACLLP